MRVILHAAHTEPVYNGNTGTSGNGVTEREIQSEVINKLMVRLEAEGHDAIRYNGTEIPTSVVGDLFLAPHCDGGPSTARGYSLCPPILQQGDLLGQSQNFVEYLKIAMAKHTPIPFRPNVTVNMQKYYGFTNVYKKMPAVILEMGFLTNSEDAAILKDTQRMANCLFDAIRNYFGLTLEQKIHAIFEEAEQKVLTLIQ